MFDEHNGYREEEIENDGISCESERGFEMR
jgi:hypothetical protein